MIEPEEAWERIEERLSPLGSESIARSSAAGRILAGVLEATIDVPGSDVSAMDGYILGADAADRAATDELPVTGVIAAGDAPGSALEPGSAMRIMTGAPVPTGGDRVVPIEDSDGGRERVKIHQVSSAGAHIRRRGEVCKVGQSLLEIGTLITDATLGLLASHGLDAIPVVRKPKLAMLTTGDEVVSPDETPAPGQLRDSHSSFFESVGTRYGESIHLLGIAPDDKRELERRIEIGLEHDVLILTGGVSKGEFDFVEDVLERHGCDKLFDAVAIQPGKPVVAAHHKKGWVFALPGNPASAMVTFWLFVRPALRRMQGIEDRYWGGAIEGALVSSLPGARGRTRYFPVSCRFRSGELEVHPHLPQGSHDVAAFASGTGLVRVEAGSAARSAGDRCQVLPLIDWWPE